MELKKDISNFTLLFLAILFAILSPTFHLEFIGNQNTYLFHAFSMAYPDSLKFDWFSTTQDGTPIFSMLSFILLKIHKLVAINFHKFFEVIFLFYISKIMITIFPSKNRMELCIFCLFITLLLTNMATGELNWGRGEYFLGGLKGQNLLGTYFQPSVFGVLFVPSLYYFLKNKLLISLILLISATYFHPSLVLTTSIIGLIYIFCLKEHNEQLRYGLLGIFLMLPLIYTIYSRLDLAFDTLAIDILVNYRIPHHAQLSLFYYGDVLKLIALVVSLNYCKDVLLKKIILATIIYISVALPIVNIIDIDSINLLFPLRISILLIPVAVYIVSIHIYFFIKEKLSLYISSSEWNKIMILTYCAFTGFAFYMNISQYSEDMTYDIDWKKWEKYSSNEVVWLVPPQDEFSKLVRLNIEQPIFVDYKNHPSLGEEIVEWKERVDIAQEFYNSSERTRQIELLERIKKMSAVDYILAPKKSDIFIPTKEISEIRGYKLLQVEY